MKEARQKARNDMYESPVNLIYHDIETQIIQQQEQTILEAIRRYDVVVDKNELIKAIEYDRNQYSKGYKDGVKDVLDKIRAEIEQAANKQFQIAMGVTDLNERYTHIRMENAYRHSLNIIDKYKAESEE